MTTEMWIVALARIAGSLPVLRWPFYGAILAILVDQSDLFMINLLDLGGVNDYQSFDKYLDQVYIGAFLVVALRWQGVDRAVAVGLFAYRLIGFIVFEAMQSRDVLLLFPNLFEFWFLLVAAKLQFGWQEALRRAASRRRAGCARHPQAIPGVRYPLPALAGRFHRR